jgi:hypothetical protein
MILTLELAASADVGAQARQLLGEASSPRR